MVRMKVPSVDTEGSKGKKPMALGEMEKERKKKEGALIDRKMIAEVQKQSEMEARIKEQRSQLERERLKEMKKGAGGSGSGSVAKPTEAQSKKRKTPLTEPGMTEKGKKKKKKTTPTLQDEEIEEQTEIPTDVLRDALPEPEEVILKTKIQWSDTEWRRSFDSRGVTCERALDVSKINYNKALVAIRRHRFTFYEGRHLRGYVRQYCVDFYSNMEIIDATFEIRSSVKGVEMSVTPDSIAGYLGYSRPTPGTYQYPSPTEQPRYTFEEVAKVMLANPKANRGNKLVLGGLHADYQLLNKVLHYNMFPRGSEYELKLQEAEFLYAFMQDDIEFDIALWIWIEMRTFRSARLQTNMPFVAMISIMVWNALSRPRVQFTPGVPSTISYVTLRAIEAKAMRPVEERSIDWRPKAGGAAKDRADEWMSALFIQGCLTRDSLKEMHHRLSWVTQVLEETHQIQYSEDWSIGERILPPPRERVLTPPLQQDSSEHEDDDDVQVDDDEETESEDSGSEEVSEESEDDTPPAEDS